VSDDLVGAQVHVGDRAGAAVGLHVLAGAVGAKGRSPRREQVAAPPDAGVHRQRDGDVAVAQLLRRVARPRDAI